MKVIPHNAIISEAVRAQNSYCIFVINDLDYENEIDKCIWETVVDYVNRNFNSNQNSILNAIINGDLMVFNSKEDAKKVFNIFLINVVYSGKLFGELFDPFGYVIDINT